MTDQHLSETRFDSLALHPDLLKGVQDVGFTHCTPIQARTLPLALSGTDVAGQAQTGTGKTAAFLLATMHHLLTHPPRADRAPTQPRALILAPTRELAVQIHADAVELGRRTDFRLGLAFGGTGYESQRRQLQEGVDILIGTPGRIIDYYKQHVFNLKAAQVMVLDEADRMFDLGFIKDIRYLLRRLPAPEKRLNMLFSATLSYRVTELAYEHMNNPTLIEIEPDKVTADKVTQRVYYTANAEKIPLLLGLLRHMDPRRTIVFVNTKRAAERVWGYLEGNGIKAAMLSGDVPQKKRLSLLRAFQSGETPVLVATDVAARGLHIPDVSHVFNFDLPQDAEDYVHRIGRTARAGASGDAISFACEDYAYSLPEIEAFIGHKISSGTVTQELLVEPRPPVRHERPRRRGGARPGGRGGPKGRRGSGRGGRSGPRRDRS
ncbi:MAG: ATP-dependent RNA helicase RhlB [Gammaproteobacteria bacterium]|nr:ATP-dependent RNA helicase RhlB [Gammaproteobacteria bacterium]NIR97440.1 ATP-dependent RNA helicase RhlB [Gammaproteobacteria bacterium]